jgi:hypothetical protein
MKNMYLQISTWQLIESRKCYNRWGRYLQKPWCHPECCNKIYNVILYQASTLTYFSTTLVLYIGSLLNLATWFPCGRGRTLFILGSLGQRSRSLTLNIIFTLSGLYINIFFNLSLRTINKKCVHHKIRPSIYIIKR